MSVADCLQAGLAAANSDLGSLKEQLLELQAQENALQACPPEICITSLYMCLLCLPHYSHSSHKEEHCKSFNASTSCSGAACLHAMKQSHLLVFLPTFDMFSRMPQTGLFCNEMLCYYVQATVAEYRSSQQQVEGKLSAAADNIEAAQKEAATAAQAAEQRLTQTQVSISKSAAGCVMHCHIATRLLKVS